MFKTGTMQIYMTLEYMYMCMKHNSQFTNCKQYLNNTLNT